MKMYKTLILLLCVSFILTAFVGCKSNDSTKPNDNSGGNNVSVDTGKDNTSEPTKPNGDITIEEDGDNVIVTLPDGSTIEVPGDAIVDGENNNNKIPDDNIVIVPPVKEEHNMQYYLDLVNKDKSENLKYNGQVKLYRTTYKTAPTFKELMIQYSEMESEKNNIIAPYSGIYTRFNLLPDNIYLKITNMTDKSIKVEDSRITQIIFILDKNMKLGDVIGETLKPVDESMTFIDSLVDIFGYPTTTAQIDDDTVELFYFYESVSITLTYNIKTNEGEMHLKYN